MKTTKVLSAISAAALLGISGVALAQGTGGAASGSSTGAPATNTLQRQDAPSSGSMSRDSQSKDGVKSNQAQGKDIMGKDTQKSSQAQDGAKSGAKSGTTVGAAPAGAINLTSEQRTTIRQEVLTPSAPRATSINFAVNVGTVVPSSVHVVEVPATLVKIHPAWKGHRFFVYNDEIIIVEPRTLKIVAVLNV